MFLKRAVNFGITLILLTTSVVLFLPSGEESSGLTTSLKGPDEESTGRPVALPTPIPSASPTVPPAPLSEGAPCRVEPTIPEKAYPSPPRLLTYPIKFYTTLPLRRPSHPRGEGSYAYRLRVKNTTRDLFLDDVRPPMCSTKSQETRVLEYSGEFGYELVGLMPFAYYLHSNCKRIHVKVAEDSEPFYFFADHLTTSGTRGATSMHCCPIKSVKFRVLNESEFIPLPLKAMYRNNLFVFPKPLFIITNKYNIEWGKRPQNFINTPSLEFILQMLVPHFQVVYVRIPAKFLHENNEGAFLNLNEKEMIRSKFPGVIIFEDLAQRFEDVFTFNELQLMLFANSEHFIAVQGGNSNFASYFGGSVLILAVTGPEVCCARWSIFEWYTRFSGANVTVVRQNEFLVEAVNVLYNNTVTFNGTSRIETPRPRAPPRPFPAKELARTSPLHAVLYNYFIGKYSSLK